MPTDKLQARADRVMMRGCIEVHLFQDNPRNGRRSLAQPITLEDIEEYVCTPPAFELRMQEAQVLMDDLWRAGLRPSEGAGSAGSLRATEKHLDDMRTIAFKKLNIEGK